MTIVSDLIEKLQKFPQNARVVIREENYYGDDPEYYDWDPGLELNVLGDVVFLTKDS